eukprot:UN08523
MYNIKRIIMIRHPYVTFIPIFNNTHNFLNIVLFSTKN